MMAPRLATFLLVATLLAGCASKPDATAQTASVEQNPPSASPSANATAANATDVAPMDMSAMVGVSYQGSSPQGVCTTTGTAADQCQFTSAGSESFHKVEYKGKAMHIRVNVTYPAQQPQFAMYASVCIGKAGAGFTTNDCKDYKTAPSPMVLDVDLTGAAVGAPIALSIGSVGGGPGAIVFAQSDFKVDGHLMSMPVA